MTRQSVPLGRIFGIPISLDYSWFLIFALMTWMLATSYYPAEFKEWSPVQYWITGAATTIMLFVSVLLHELGHSVAARSYKIPVRRITLFIFGGVAEIGSEAPTPMAEFVIAIAGPIVSLMLAVVFRMLEGPVASVAPLFALTKYLAYINFSLVLFNLIPGFPLDGGRVFRAIVWGATGDLTRATLIAATVGRAFGFLFIMFGVWQMFTGNFGGGLWIIFIGWFLDSAAAAQVQQLMLRRSIAGHTVAQAMNRQVPTVPADLSLQQLVDDHLFGNGGRSFVVARGDHPEGLLTLGNLKETPRSQWPTTTTEQAMIPLARIKKSEPDTELWTALKQMDRDGVNQLPVMTNGHVVGMLSRDDLIGFLNRLQELGV
jgi:Zn-dependent protease